jgi:hypothetical protein
MKKTILVVPALILTAAMAFAVDELPFAPVIPQIMGQGGSLNASAQGYTSFFTNPAGFSRSPGEFSIAATTWIYARPDNLLGLLGSMAGSQSTGSELLDYVNSEVTGGGFGVGALAGIGWAGNGVGLGAFLLLDSYMWGPTLLGITGDLTATAAFVLGLSVPLQLGGLTIHVGGDIRPMIRIHTFLDSSVAFDMIQQLAEQGDVMSALNSAQALHGMGLALDLGVIAELGWLSFGISARDLGGTTFSYARSPFGAVVDSLASSQQLPEGEAVTESYTVPMDVSAGVAIHPNMGGLKWLIDPTVHLELGDVLGVIQEQKSPWTLLHVGAQVKLLTVFTAQAGLDQGYFTAGAGVHLLFLDANFALFTRELGVHIGDRPSSGATLEVAIRF